MTLRERLRQLAEALPRGGAVTFSRDDLLAMLEEDGAENSPAERSTAVLDDLTVEDIMQATNRARSTVCGWMPELKRLGAYKLGREWRVPRATWEAFLAKRRDRQQGAAAPSSARRSSKVDTGSWRRLRKAG